MSTRLYTLNFYEDDNNKNLLMSKKVIVDGLQKALQKAKKLDNTNKVKFKIGGYKATIKSYMYLRQGLYKQLVKKFGITKEHALVILHKINEEQLTLWDVPNPIVKFKNIKKCTYAIVLDNSIQICENEEIMHKKLIRFDGLSTIKALLINNKIVKKLPVINITFA